MPSISEATDAGEPADAAAPDQSAEAGPSSAPQAPQTAVAAPTAGESSKPKATKKPKAKAKANADGTAADVKPARTSLRGGMIGIASADPPAPAWLPAGGGARKALPELVLPFKLPTSVKGGEDGFSDGSDAGGSEDDDESSEESEAEGDGEAARRARLEKRRRKERRAVQRSLLQIQSLRQSRLFHLASLLAPYSRRTKAGVSYPASVSPDMLHGIEPSVKGSHILTPLSRVEVQVGPHFFAKTKLWEMRKEREPRTTSPPPPKKAQPAAPSQPAASQQPSKAAQPASAPRPVQPPQPPAPRPTPPTAAATAAVDPVLVTRVNERASKDADLRDLLQVAARGAASPEQLRVLGEVIQDVTREMERDGLKVQPPQAIARAPPPPPAAAPVATPPPKAQPKAPKGQPKKTVTAGAPAKKIAAPQAAPSGEGAKQPEPQQVQQAQGRPEGEVATTSISASATAVAPASSFRPPILVMEFRENPSMRFYVPLWSSIVHRRKYKRSREVGEGGIEEEEELPEEPAKEKELIEFIEVQLQFLAPVPGSDAAVGTGAEAKYPILMTITGEDSNRTIWEAIGRVPGVRTLDAGGREVFEEPKEDGAEASSQADKERNGVEELEATIAKAIAALPRRRSLNLSAPLPRGLEDHLADKFAPQLQSTASLYTSSSSRDAYPNGAGAGAGGAGKRRTSPMDVLHDDLHDLTAGGGLYDFDGSLSLSGGLGGGSAPKPKKKRNVATHNPDGSIKRCNSCQTNVTPMWRRGPEGPATLCNACGARWKSGRLGMPSARGRKGSVGLGGGAGGGGEAGRGDGVGGGDIAVGESQNAGEIGPTSTEPARAGEGMGEQTQADSSMSQPTELAATAPAAAAAPAAKDPAPHPQNEEDVAMVDPEAEADASANTSAVVEEAL